MYPSVVEPVSRIELLPTAAEPLIVLPLLLFAENELPLTLHCPLSPNLLLLLL